MRKRNEAILIRLTEKEKRHLEQQAKISGLKMEPYVRKLIMGIEMRPRPPDEYLKILRELSAIGNNANQLAYKANALGIIQVNEVREMREAFDKVWREVKRM